MAESKSEARHEARKVVIAHIQAELNDAVDNYPSDDECYSAYVAELEAILEAINKRSK